MGIDWNQWFGREHPSALSQAVILECTWTDCPVDVQDEVSQLWNDYRYGNDNYYHQWDWDDNPIEYPIINKYLLEHNIESTTNVLIHYWW